MWRAIASNALTLFIVGLVVVAGLLTWGRQAYTNPGPLAEAFSIDRFIEGRFIDESVAAGVAH